MDMLKIIAAPIHREGWRFVGIFAVATALATLVWHPLFWPGLVLTGWCYYFFRDPARMIPQREGLVVSPADGKVSMITEAAPPAELEMGDAPRTRISVFMNVFNCHVNRAPVAGTIGKIAYFPGKFLNASLDKASEHNERNALSIKMDDGRAIAVVQIAGLVARRILCEVAEGRRMDAGERFGLIRFGSRLDIYLPDGAQPLVCIGQTSVAGETVLADLASDEARRIGREI